MTKIAGNINHLKRNIPESVKLVAVTKTKPITDIQEAYDTSHRIFGENRVQELLSKKDNLPGDIEWHLIGHLQTNKVKFIVPFIGMIQSVDSFKLLKAINSEASRISRVVNCLLQIHIADEETKFGFSIQEITDGLRSEEFASMKNVRICGVMGMATFTDDSEKVKREFRYLKESFNKLKSGYFANDNHFREISMGMSGDYELAIEEGSTIVRIGSLIFGERNLT